MSTLFLDRKDLTLEFEGQCIALYEQGVKRGTVPLHLLGRVVMRGQVNLDTRLLGALAEKNIGVLMLSGRNHRSMAMLLGKPHNDSRRRVAQYAGYLDREERFSLSRWVVIGKLRSQKRLLKAAMTQRPDLRHALSAGIATLNTVLLQLTHASFESSLEQLRGFEGSGAAAYFKAYCLLFAPSLNFNSRKRRPPPDPVNACLSLGYTLLHFDAVKACHESGLDPYIGFFHDLAFSRESLACDFIEMMRAELDGLIWRLFRERVLRAENFSNDNGQVLLNKSGRERFYAEYELFARPARRLLRRYGYLLAKRFVNNDFGKDE
jgi:CRISPR-associated protein Cas1